MSQDPLTALRLENDLLRERVDRLEDVLGAKLDLPRFFKLTIQEERIVKLLFARSRCSKNQIMQLLYAGNANDEPDEGVLKVFVCKIRHKLADFDIEILTEWGRGFAMPPASKDLLRHFIELWLRGESENDGNSKDHAAISESASSILARGMRRRGP